MLCHRERKHACILTSNSTRHWLWNPIQLSTTQLKKRNRVTLEGRAANVSVAKQWQTAGRQRCLAGLVKTARLHTAMQSKRTTKSWAVRQGGVSSKLKQPGRGLFKSIRQTAGKCANKQPSADNPPPAQPPPPPPPPPLAWKETSGQTNIQFFF